MQTIGRLRKAPCTGARSFTVTADCLGDFKTTENQVANPGPLAPQAKSLTNPFTVFWHYVEIVPPKKEVQKTGT